MTSEFDMHVVGKDSWKDCEVGNFCMESFKLENSFEVLLYTCRIVKFGSLMSERTVQLHDLSNYTWARISMNYGLKSHHYFLDEIPQKSKNGINHGLPNPNNASDLSDHPFRIHPVAEIITESTTKISYINNDTVGNTTIRNYSTVT